MREALARTDFDFSVSEPGPSARRDGAPARFPKILRVASLGTAVVVCAVIVCNALFLQDRKHAAPLLRVPEASTPVATAVPNAPALRSITAATPQTTRDAGRDAIADEINRLSGPADKKVAKAMPAVEAARTDPIAGLIGAAPEANASVLAAQKALVRLGYVLRADGVIGASTRQAVERYERDNKLPVRGELTPKLARELTAKSARLGQ